MDRSELEELISQTMPTLLSATLSPKQQFQSQVRGLTGRPRHAHAQSESDAAPISRHHELHHVSTLRVQHKRNASALPSRGRAALSETSHNLNRGQKAPFADDVVPDFSAAEREAWSKKSPLTMSASTRSRHRDRGHSPARQQAVPPHQPPIFPPPERLEPIPQPRKHARTPSLRPFEPLLTEVDVERPKTSRGIETKSSEQTQPPTNTGKYAAETNEVSCADAVSQANRRSKFLEGSMNDRSVAVASSWYHDNTSGSDGFHDAVTSPTSDTDTDGDETPRAAQAPPTLTPSTIKKSIFRFGGGRSSEDSAHTVEDAPKNAKERKGLRKSISIWNFREKIFGGSGSDAASETSTDARGDKRRGAQKEKATGSGADMETLNERKRKAQEAYAQQFGVKKQKSNQGLSVAATAAAGVTAPTPVLDSKRPRTPTLFRRKRDQHLHGDPKRAVEALDAQKRLSRTELEKENQQLRNMLRQSHSVYFSRSPSLSSVDLQLKGPERFVHGPVVTLSPGKKQGRRGEDIPPVPKLPDQTILAEMQNRSRLLRPGLDAGKENQGSFETIEEREEGVATGRGDGDVSIPGHWEWPDDVF